MDKMAIFVEGQTEQVFVEQLVYEVAGRHRVHVDTVKGFGGKKSPRQYMEIQVTRPNPKKEYYVLICDCSNDSRVLSDIRDQYSSLTSQGFREIVGVRDVYPLPATDIATIRSDFSALAPSSTVVPVLVLSVMESEAWFIAEYSHFFRMHSLLIPSAVNAALGYDPSTHDVQTVAHPAEDLDRAYRVAGLSYNKSRKHVQRTVQVISYASVYLEVPRRIPDLQTLVDCIDRFLS